MEQFIQFLFEVPGVFWAGVAIQLALIMIALLFLSPPRFLVPTTNIKFKKAIKFLGIVFVALAFSWSFILGSATIIFERHDLL